MKGLYWCCKADFGEHEPDCPNVSWINEDELPKGYPYDEMFPHSKLGQDGRGGVRIFPKVG